jgi:HEAT repeat protein
MTLSELFQIKDIKPNKRTGMISDWLLNNTISITELIEFADKQKDSVKAMCIEAIEYATKVNPGITDISTFEFVTESLKANSPSIKRESARVIGNIAHQFTNQLEQTIINLIANTEYNGTVVRWSAAYALGEIVKLNTKHNHDLIPAIENICEKEEKNSIRKIYQAAIKKLPH